MRKEGKILPGKIKSRILHASIKLMEQYFTDLVLDDTTNCWRLKLWGFLKVTPDLWIEMNMKTWFDWGTKMLG